MEIPKKIQKFNWYTFKNNREHGGRQTEWVGKKKAYSRYMNFWEQ